MTAAHGRGLIAAARQAGYAIPAFNIANLETAQAVVAAAEGARAPIIVQLSPGALAYAGYDALTRIAFDVAERAAVPVQVHLDHCTDPQVVERAVGDGFGSVMFDGSSLPLDANVEATARAVAIARPRGVNVEAELGIIGARGDMTIAEAWAGRTRPDEAARFVALTGIDVLAPALGTLHRMPADSVPLDLDHLASIARAADRPLALHGGSGIERAVLGDAIAAGIAKVNISSQVGRAMAEGIRRVWSSHPDELDLRRYLGEGRTAVIAMASEYIELCGAAGRSGPGTGDDGSDVPRTVAASFASGGSEME